MPNIISYVLKHKNIDVAQFSIDKTSWSAGNIVIIDTTFSPVNTEAGNDQIILTFNNWLNNRCIPDSRDGIERLKAVYKITDLKELMLAGYGLSLSDHYWICNESCNIKWEDINYFDNRYSENMGKIFFDKNFRKLNDDINSPDSSLNGTLRKRWECNIDNYLLKGGSGIYKQEPFNEVYASMLLDELKIDHVQYKLRISEGEYVSSCPCIIDKDTEIITAMDIVRKYGIKKNYREYADICLKNGLSAIEDELKKMIITDYIIRNTDRHWNNFGIIRNSDTGAWFKPIPLFDNGCSLWNNEKVDVNVPSHSSSFCETNEENLKIVNFSEYIKAENIKKMSEIFSEAFKDFEDENRKEELRKGVQEKEEIMLKLMDESHFTTSIAFSSAFSSSSGGGSLI